LSFSPTIEPRGILSRIQSAEVSLVSVPAIRFKYASVYNVEYVITQRIRSTIKTFFTTSNLFFCTPEKIAIIKFDARIMETGKNGIKYLPPCKSQLLTITKKGITKETNKRSVYLCLLKA
jgi:hypothetical protein